MVFKLFGSCQACYCYHDQHEFDDGEKVMREPALGKDVTAKTRAGSLPDSNSFHSAASEDNPNDNAQGKTKKKLSRVDSAVAYLSTTMKDMKDALFDDKTKSQQQLGLADSGLVAQSDHDEVWRSANRYPEAGRSISKNNINSGFGTPNSLNTANSFVSCTTNDNGIGNDGGALGDKKIIGFNSVKRVEGHPNELNMPQTWYPLIGTSFHVRYGPNYKKNGKKGPSKAALFDCRGIDMVCGNSIVSNISERLKSNGVAIPDTPAGTPDDPQIPAVLIINAQVPTSTNAGVSLISYSVISESVRNSIGSTAEPSAIRLLRQLIRTKKSSSDLPFKVIGEVVDIDEYNLPGLVKKKNGKPALITASADIKTGKLTQLPGAPSYLEIDYDIRKWSFFARQSLSMFRNTAQSMCLNIGYLIETGDDTLLPEQILTSFCLQKIDINESVRNLDEDAN